MGEHNEDDANLHPEERPAKRNRQSYASEHSVVEEKSKVDLWSLFLPTVVTSINALAASLQEAEEPRRSQMVSKVLADVLSIAHSCAASNINTAVATQVADAIAQTVAIARLCKGAETLPAWSSLAWICAVLGQPHEEVFGLPSVMASSSTSTLVWDSLVAFSKPGRVGHMLASSPFPLLWLPDWIADDEISDLMDAAELLWQPSPLATSNAGHVTSVRTSDSAVLSRSCLGSSSVAQTVQKLQKQAARLVGLPASHCEPPQLVRYALGQRYLPHVDWGHSGDASLFVMGQRVATVLVYLTDVPTHCVGGSTCFSHLGPRGQQLQIVPVRGAACAWPNVSAAGMPLFESEHSAEPLEVKLCKRTVPTAQEDLVKVALNLWIRERPVQDEAALTHDVL